MAEPSKEAMAIAESDRRQMAEDIIDAFARQVVEQERARCVYWIERGAFELSLQAIIAAIRDGRPKP